MPEICAALRGAALDDLLHDRREVAAVSGLIERRTN
jgi:hypothetical protein